jgi:hypothetical protein
LRKINTKLGFVESNTGIRRANSSGLKRKRGLGLKPRN